MWQIAQKDFKIVENLQHTATTFTPHKWRRYGLCGVLNLDNFSKREYNVYIRLRELRNPTDQTADFQPTITKS